jgi:hypothetical protein
MLTVEVEQPARKQVPARLSAPASAGPKYVSLKAVAERWACDRTTVRRNLEAAGVKAFCFGHGRHGIVRYPLRDVEEYERRCREP